MSIRTPLALICLLPFVLAGCEAGDDVDEFLGDDDFADFAGEYDDDAPAFNIGGGRLEAGYPSVGYLMRNGFVFCSGVKVANNLLLTAAHCVQNRERGFQVGFGRVGQNIRVNAVDSLRHPYYNPGLGVARAARNDIALVKLSAAPNIPNAVVGESRIGGLAALGDGRSVGYGITTVRSTGQRRSVQQLFADYTASSVILTNGRGGDVCPGDSGGGYMVQSEQNVVRGIHSFKTGGRGCDGTSLTGSVDLFLPENKAFLGFFGARFRR
jgi:V8-like Glu-specific endopeptidase